MQADGGVEAEELPQALAAGAAELLLAVAGGEVADELLEAAAGGGVRAMGAVARWRLAAGGPDVGAAVGADVLQALHGLAKFCI